MELQWPLIIFTAFVAWSAGLFATQSALALKGECAKAQKPALIASVIILAVGGIAVFFHLEHWERIFNGFGHLTSGITQELICVVIMVVVMVVYFFNLRNNDDSVSKPVAIAGIASAVLLVVIAGASYLMSARPTWDNPVEILSLVGNACILGPATLALIASAVDSEAKVGSDKLPTLVLFGAGANAVTTILYLVVMLMAGSSFMEVGLYFDPVHPTGAIVTPEAANPFVGKALAMSIVAIVTAIAAPIVSFVGREKDSWKSYGSLVLVLGLVAAIALRMVFYTVGISVFMFY